MIVSELIERLRGMDQTGKVLVYSDMAQAYFPIEGVRPAGADDQDYDDPMDIGDVDEIGIPVAANDCRISIY